jgi:cell wall-associated NlpC family hydrolase
MPGIYLSNDSAQKLSGDLFEQSSHGYIADQFEQQATAALPDMLEQAHAQEQARQVAEAKAAQDAQQASLNSSADNFMAQVPDVLAQHLGNAPATPPDAPAPPSADATMDTSTPPVTAPSVPVTPEPAPAAPAPTAPAQPATPVPSVQTTAGLSGGGDLSGRVGAAGQAILSAAGDAASWLGDQGQKALVAVLITEGGLSGARGDKGQSAGPLQFFEGGQLANFAQQHGLTPDQAKSYVEQNPNAAVQWAIGTADQPGYLGAAILKGQQQGLTGPDLATYAQQHGQVSVSPERAGQNWQSMFGDGANAISGAVQQAAKDPSSILDAVKPFLGQAYQWGGKSPTSGFDCSGLAGYLTTGQAESTTSLYGKSAAVTQPQPGDLVFYNMGSSDPHMQHVAVYLGDGKVVQSGGTQNDVNIGSADQNIGSPPEFRRVGDGGMPAQAALAKDQGVPAEASAAAPPADQTTSSWLDPLKGLASTAGNAIGNTASAAGSAVQSGLQGLQGIFSGAPDTSTGSLPNTRSGGLLGSLAAPQDVQQANAAAIANTDTTTPQKGPLDYAGDAINALGASPLGQLKTQMAPSILDPGAAQRNDMTDPNNALNVVLGAEGSGMNVAKGLAGHLAQPVESAIADAAGAVKPGALEQAQAAVDALKAARPEMSPGSLAASGVGKALAAAKAEAPAIPSPYPSYPAPPPAPAAAQPQAGTDMLNGLIQMAKARGMDTSAFEAEVAKMAPAEVPAAAVSRPHPGPGAPLPPEVPPAPPPGSLPAEVGAVPPSTPTGGAQPWDYLRALRVGSLAGGVQTMSHILLNAPLQTAFKLVSDAPLSLRAPETIPLEFMGAWQGFRGWAAKAASAPMGEPAKIAQSIGGPLGTAVETGLLGLVKTHPVIQDAARQIGSGMELWRLAGLDASGAGLQRFSGPWWTHVQQMVAEPSEAMTAAATRAGDTFSLTGPMGQTGEAFAKLKGNSHMVDFVMPFFNIGYHVASQGIERSPIGLLGTGFDVARGALGHGPYAAGALGEGVTPLAQRFRNNLVGTGLAIEAFHQAAQGNITGNGPDDPGLKADLTATGWQPDSIRIGGRYFPLHVLGPQGWALSEAANLYESTHTSDQGGVAKPNADLQGQLGSYVSRMAQYGSNETFLSSIARVLQAAASTAQGQKMAESEIASTLGSLVPQGALFANAAASMDPYNRKPTSGDIGATIQSRIPGMRQDLPLRLTPTGQPEPNAQQGLGILLPRSSLVNPDPVISAMGQAGIGAPTVPKTVSVTSKYQMDLTPQEQEQWQELRGKALNEQLKDAVADPDWKSLPIEKRRALIQKAGVNASDIARKQLLDTMPDADIEKRIQLKTDAAAGNRVTVLGGAP